MAFRAFINFSFAIIFTLSAWIHPNNQAYAVDLIDIKIVETSSSTKVTLLFNTPHSLKSFHLSHPSRAVIDIEDTSFLTSIPRHIPNTHIKNIRHSADEKTHRLRLVFDLFEDISILSTHAEGQKFHLILGLGAKSDTHHKEKELSNIPTPTYKKNTSLTSKNEILKPAPTPIYRPYIPLIVIDAGHGGKDPGAISSRGVKEKNITLSYARNLKEKIEDTGRYRVILTRNSDRYLTLSNRVKIAHNVSADMFISLHANAHKSRHVRGFSLYTLSEKASDKEARALAIKENKEDIINGINLEHEDKDISTILIDLAQRETKNESGRFASILVKHAGNNIRLLERPHRFAGFRVLTGPDVPSVLIELGYLTNRREERLLRSTYHKNKVTNSLLKGIDEYFKAF